MLAWCRSVAWFCVILGTAACSGGGSDVGDQREVDPIAIAEVEGLGATTGGRYLTRSLTDVLITGKNSDGVDDPLLTFDWRQTGGEQVTLYERGTNSRMFTTPLGPTTLEFELTVEDTDGATASDSVIIDVLGIADVDDFLKDPSVDETFYLFVSPDLAAIGPMLPSAFSYQLTITPVVYWTDRRGNSRSQALEPVLDRSDIVEQDFAVTSDPLDPRNDHFAVPLPMLDIDEVNSFFQSELRSGRLELEEVRNSRVELEIELSSMATPGVDVYLARRTGGTFLVIPSDTVVPDPAAQNPADALLSAQGPTTIDIDLELLRQALHVESRLSASNYYDCIDPSGQSATLSGWLSQAGFGGGADVLNTKYVNNYDLGFGRNMFVRVDDAGNVYSYVVNYPSLETLLRDQGEFATVVMEYSAAPVGSCDNPSFNPDRKIVKFYAYVPNTRTGEMVRAESMNFDGRGERFLPGVCTACHGGSVERILEFGNADAADIDASSTDLYATFMPWDLDSFLYTRADDPDLVDPSLTQSEFTAEVLEQYSREAQEDSFRRMNEAVLRTYAGDWGRAEEPLRLIHGWYGNESTLPPRIEDDPSTSEDETDDAANSHLGGADYETLVSLPDVSFDGSYVQSGWAGQEVLYSEVFARNCRLCHAQQYNLARNFESYDEFVNAANLDSYVFTRGVMPASRLTMDRFWVDFQRGEDSAAEALRLHLNTFRGADIPPDRVPGRVTAIASADPSSLPIDTSGKLIPSEVSLFSDGSLFADDYFWMVSGDPACPGVPMLAGEESAQASMLVTESPCELEVQLSVSSDRTGETDSETIVVTSDQTPLTVDFDAPLVDYTPGDSSLTIDILSQIDATIDGDGGLTLTVDEPNVNLVPPSAVNISFPALAGTSETIMYQITDVNGTTGHQLVNGALVPHAGSIRVEVDEIFPVLTLSGPPVAGEIDLAWDWNFCDVPVPPMPACSLQADYYSLDRAVAPVTSDGDFVQIAGNLTSQTFTDSVGAGETYVYRLTAVYQDEASQPSELTVSTSGAPTGLQASWTSSSITLTWMSGDASQQPTSYTVYLSTTTPTPSTVTVEVEPSMAGELPPSEWTFDGLSQNTGYSLQVRQNSSASTSALSDSLSVTTDVAAPANLVVAPKASTSDQIALSWDDPDGGEAPTYEVWRTGAPGPLAVIDEPFSSHTFDDSGLSSDTVYMYEVRSLGSNGSQQSASGSAQTYPEYDPNITDRLNGGIVSGVNCNSCHLNPIQTNITNGAPQSWPGAVGCLTNTAAAIQGCDSLHGTTWSNTALDLFRRWSQYQLP